MQIFQILTHKKKIVLIRPYNPFAQGVVERINILPIEEQALELDKSLKISNVVGELEILTVNNTVAINIEKDIIIYKLTLH